MLLLFPLSPRAQQKTVTGTVKDENGEVLSNISVAVRNGKAGTTTDVLGKFRITASVGSELVFTSATHEPFSLKIDQRDDYLVALKQASGALNDVVVVGYGRQKKVNLVGAVGTVQVARCPTYPQPCPAWCRVCLQYNPPVWRATTMPPC